MVAQESGAGTGREPVTVADIARLYRRSARVVREKWVRTDAWQSTVRVVGKRGRWRLYDADDVEAFARQRVWLPPRDTDVPPGRLLDQAAIAEYTGIDISAVWSDVSRGRLGEPDDTRDGVRRWKRSTVDEHLWARQRKREG